jgi:hypothetical protein
MCPLPARSKPENNTVFAAMPICPPFFGNYIYEYRIPHFFLGSALHSACCSSTSDFRAGSIVLFGLFHIRL